MKKVTGSLTAAALLWATVQQGAMAATAVSPIQPAEPILDRSLVASAFDGIPAGVSALDQQTLEDTQGELWMFIAAVGALDLALISAFWGVYVPYYGAGTGGCFACESSTVYAR